MYRALVQTNRTLVNTFTIDGESRILRESVETFGWAVGAELGLLRRLSRDWDWGGTIGLEEVTGGKRIVLAGHLRRQLPAGLTLDVKPGLFVHGSGPDRKIGALVATGVGHGSWATASLRWEAMSVDPFARTSGSRKEVDPGGFQQALSGGVGLTNEVGLIGFVVVAVATWALVAALAP